MGLGLAELVRAEGVEIAEDGGVKAVELVVHGDKSLAGDLGGAIGVGLNAYRIVFFQRQPLGDAVDGCRGGKDEPANTGLPHSLEEPDGVDYVVLDEGQRPLDRDGDGD